MPETVQTSSCQVPSENIQKTIVTQGKSPLDKGHFITVDENGPKYLEDNPYKTFIELIESGTSDRSTAGAVLCFLVSGLSQNISSDSDIAELSKQIQKECGFNKKMADRIATIFAQLYSQENEEEWKKKDMGGLKGFLKE